MIAPMICTPAGDDPGKGQRDGEAEKARALRLLSRTRAVLIRKAKRLFLQSLLTQGHATVDDVRLHLEIPPGIDPRFMGAVPGDFAKDSMIESVDLVPSCRPATHCSHRNVWRLLDVHGAEQWLESHPELREYNEKGEPAATDSPDADSGKESD